MPRVTYNQLLKKLVARTETKNFINANFDGCIQALSQGKDRGLPKLTGYPQDVDNDKYLTKEQRAKVCKLNPDFSIYDYKRKALFVVGSMLAGKTDYYWFSYSASGQIKALVKAKPEDFQDSDSKPMQSFDQVNSILDTDLAPRKAPNPYFYAR